MWQAALLNALSKFALPIAGAALAVIVSLSAALWWTNGRLDTARAELADSRADTLTCIAANATQRQAIAELEQAVIANRTQREEAIRRQREALERIDELEAERSEQTDETIRKVVVAADGDACAHARLPDAVRLRIAPRGDADQDGNS